ncbi:hypothetical protein F2Q70_00042902 [Brassica cretica]|uniref:Uncharacterized protein n=1 Tax=Brassica cretica TaxID=69181 RepID=A0A8S9KHM7_BRACR|nr:hypothetical protein F2Q70_00042902 [Brassica cretica]
MDIDDDGGGGDYRRRSSRNTTMSTAAEASGGLKQPAGDKDGCDDVGIRLPERLFATDRFPSERVNMYSTVDLLLWVRDVLSGSPRWTSCWVLALQASFRCPPGGSSPEKLCIA